MDYAIHYKAGQIVKGIWPALQSRQFDTHPEWCRCTCTHTECISFDDWFLWRMDSLTQNGLSPISPQFLEWQIESLIDLWKSSESMHFWQCFWVLGAYFTYYVGYHVVVGMLKASKHDVKLNTHKFISAFISPFVRQQAEPIISILFIIVLFALLR